MKMIITPQKAARLIGRFEEYTDIDYWVVSYYVSLLKRGLDLPPGRDPIKFRYGFVSNGRHRILALVIANKTRTCEVDIED